MAIGSCIVGCGGVKPGNRPCEWARRKAAACLPRWLNLFVIQLRRLAGRDGVTNLRHSYFTAFFTLPFFFLKNGKNGEKKINKFTSKLNYALRQKNIRK